MRLDLNITSEMPESYAQTWTIQYKNFSHDSELNTSEQHNFIKNGFRCAISFICITQTGDTITIQLYDATNIWGDNVPEDTSY